MNPEKEYVNVNYRDKSSLRNASLNETALTDLSSHVQFNSPEPANTQSLPAVAGSNGVLSNRALRNSKVQQDDKAVEGMWNTNAMWEES